MKAIAATGWFCVNHPHSSNGYLCYLSWCAALFGESKRCCLSQMYFFERRTFSCHRLQDYFLVGGLAHDCWCQSLKFCLTLAKNSEGSKEPNSAFVPCNLMPSDHLASSSPILVIPFVVNFLCYVLCLRYLSIVLMNAIVAKTST